MALPVVPLPTGSVEVEGQTVEVRGLARAEVHLMAKHADDPAGAEAFMLACGCGVTQDEAKSWLESTPAGVADAVLSKVMELSGLDGLGKESSGG